MLKPFFRAIHDLPLTFNEFQLAKHASSADILIVSRVAH
jgi:hypothetical protein